MLIPCTTDLSRVYSQIVMKPFLKWAGNKFHIIERIKAILPMGNRLVEPFAGSAAVFLNTDYSDNLVADSNPDLIQTYLYLQMEGSKFINYCESLFIAENNKADRFYEFREQFNTTADARLKSALFIYLNKHCFNGLCRYNNKGQFNTPFGKYAKPYFPHKEMEYFHQRSLTAKFAQSDFISTFAMAKPNDIVYCDPPYVPLSKTANFTSYSPGGFGMEQQQQLADLANDLAKEGITVVISNHQTKFIEQVYKNAKLISFPVQRYISCDRTNRYKTNEVLAIFGPTTPRRKKVC